MHEGRQWRIVSYDIRDPKRRRTAHKLLKGYGEAVQYSVFRCQLDDRQLAALRAQLAVILTANDDLLIIDPRRVVTTKRGEIWDRPPPTFSVVLRSLLLPRGARGEQMEGRS